MSFHNIDLCKDKAAELKQWKQKGLVSMVRKGIYLPSDLLDKFKIACSSVDNGILCYHSALEYYLLQTQEFNWLYLHSTKSFRDFEYLGITHIYKPLQFLHNPTIIGSNDGFNVMVTSLEQTIIDCIYNINLAGGLEELIYALEETDGLSIKEYELKKCLEKYNSKSLYQRTGFLLYPFKFKWGLSDDFFLICKNKSKGNTSYLINSFYCDGFNKEWNICIPQNMSKMFKY